MQQPLAYRMRPKNLDEVVGQKQLVGPGKVIRRMVEAKMLSSMILYGPPGTGKTSIASAIAGSTRYAFRMLNAATDTKKDLQVVAEEAKMSGTVILLLDEVHRLDKTKQDFLLPHLESGRLILIGATTENPYITINPAIRSRTQIFEVLPLTEEDILSIQEESKKPVKKSKSGVVIEGVGDVAVRFSKCCNPVPGDEIIGFITRGRGVSIHRTDCINILNVSEEEKERLIDAEWLIVGKEIKNLTYQTEIRVIGEDRMGMIVDISRVLTEEKIPVKALNARTTKNNESIINITMEISGVQQLETIIRKIKSIVGINDIIRVTT